MLAKLTNFLVAFGPWGVLALAFVDSAGLPVAGGLDALVIFLAAKDPARAYWLALLAVLGSAAGNIILFWMARQGGRRFQDDGAQAGKAPRFRAWFRRYGLVTIFVPALVPIPMPLKACVISAGVLRTGVMPFLAVILLARVLRYFSEAYLGVMLGEQSAAYLKSHAGRLIALSVVLFLALYFLVRLNDRRRQALRRSTLE